MASYLWKAIGTGRYQITSLQISLKKYCYCRSVHLTQIYTSQWSILPRSFCTSSTCLSYKNKSLWSSIKDINETPLPALAYGISGLIPFVLPCSYLALQDVYSSSAGSIQLAYGATILAFLGGVKWGYAIHNTVELRPKWDTLGWSVAPSLIAWVALLIPQQLGLLTLSAGLIVAGYHDIFLTNYPAWFQGLRLCLSTVAVLSVMVTFLISFWKPWKNVQKNEQ